MTWNDFLRRMADDYSLSPEQTDVFVARFSEVKKNKPENEIEENIEQHLGIAIDVDAYKKRRTGIYDKFTQSKQNPYGCTDINYKGPHKGKKLLNWLENKYQEELPQSLLSSTLELSYPEGSVSLDSPYYIDRGVESKCYDTILQPGSLIRIKAPKQMGKTSLLNRILEHAAKSNIKSVDLNLSLANQDDLKSLDRFLRWFCKRVCRGLNLPDKLDEYWYEDNTSNVNCTDYLEEYILTQIDTPIALGLDDVDRIFPYSENAQEFFALLRVWHEYSKKPNSIWKKLRLVIVHSTEVYIPMDTNRSPFNVGLPIDLPEFTLEQVQNLARRYKIDCRSEVEEKSLASLLAMVGGHPYLIQLAMYHLARQDVKLEKLLETAVTDIGIYKDHLQKQGGTLAEYLELREAFKQVVAAKTSVQLEQLFQFKLLSMGLVKQDKNGVTPFCQLYRQYFSDKFRE